MTNTAYTLTGIILGAGQCDCCGRGLKRLFKVTGPDGQMVLGTKCCRNLTGWTPDVARAEFLEARAARIAEIREQGHGDLFDELTALAAETAKRCGTAGIAGEGLTALLGSWASVKRYFYSVNIEFAYRMLEEARAHRFAA